MVALDVELRYMRLACTHWTNNNYVILFFDKPASHEITNLFYILQNLPDLSFFATMCDTCYLAHLAIALIVIPNITLLFKISEIPAIYHLVESSNKNRDSFCFFISKNFAGLIYHEPMNTRFHSKFGWYVNSTLIIDVAFRCLVS